MKAGGKKAWFPESLECQYYKYHTYDDDLLYLLATYGKLEVSGFIIWFYYLIPGYCLSLADLKIWKGLPKAIQVLVQESREIRKVTLEL